VKIATEGNFERESKFSELALSDRQKDILHLLAKGKSNKEIAFDLGITEGTVKQHLFTLFKKIGVTNRTKAVLKAEDLLKGYLTNIEDANLVGKAVDPELPSDYVWRMVTVVAVCPRAKPIQEPGAVARFDHALQRLRADTQALISVLDGQMITIPGGTIYAVFGAPKSHLDDAARGVFIAIKVSEWIHKQADLQAGIGIATAATLVGFGNEPLYRSDAFDLAQDLAGHAENGQILATDPSCRAAGPTFTYRPYGESDSFKKFVVKEVSAQGLPNHDLLAKKYPISFFSELLLQTRENKTQWVTVEGWPPSAGAQLMDIMSAHCQAANHKTYRLRLATAKDQEQTAGNIFQQLKLIARLRERAEGNEEFLSPKTNVMSAVSALQVLCMRGPTAILVYGVDSLDVLKLALGEKGIQKISKLPLVFVTSSRGGDHSPHLTVKFLDHHANETQAGHTYRLTLKQASHAKDDPNLDLITMLDTLSPHTRKALKTFVASGKLGMVTGDKEIGQMVGKELLISGLFRLEDQAILYRNEAVKEALQHFYQSIAALE
jgi:DNA-binding CsgD family transcriptional regulator